MWLASVASRVGLGLMALVSLPLALLAYGYLFGLAPPEIVATNPLVSARMGLLATHAALGATALLIAFLQILPQLRNGYPSVHRWMGRLYVACCLLGGVLGFPLAMTASSGPVTAFGFGFLALLWVATTATGWRFARLGRTRDHRRWMLRSFAMTFAFVTFRLELQVLWSLGLSFEAAYQSAAVLCWSTNLAAVEAILRRTPRPRAKAVGVPA